MIRLDEQDRVKLHILNSLARSQRALARMMESMADVVGQSEPAAQKLVEQIDAISRYQREVAVKMIGVKIRRRKTGAPGRPWLCPGADCATQTIPEEE